MGAVFMDINMLMTKLGVLDTSNMNLHDAEPLILTPEKQKMYDEFNEGKKFKKDKKSKYEMRSDLINYVKENGLTIRQAQKLFNDCADCILDKKIL